MNEISLDSLPEQIATYIRELRRECRKYRIANNELSVAQQDLTAQLYNMENRLILAEAKAQAMVEGLTHPDWMGIADLTGVEINDLGVIVGLSDAIARFKVQKPNFFRRKQ